MGYKPSQMHNDGWTNILTGRGIKNRDKSEHTHYISNVSFNKINELINMYTTEGFTKRVIDIPVDDMVRNWVKIEGDTDGAILNKMAKLSAKRKFKNALKWADLTGGSVIVMVMDDGGDLDEELNESKIRDIIDLQVYDRTQITWTSNYLYDEPKKEKYGQPEFYDINPINGTPFKIHESRVIRFDGDDIPNRIKTQNNGWGLSRIIPIMERLKGLGSSYKDVEQIINEFIIGVLSIDNLEELLSTPGGEDLIKKRLNLIDLSKGVLNSILVDGQEKYERVSAQVSGISDLINTIKFGLSSISGIPTVKLFGEQSKGLGGESAGSIRLYYDGISARQEEKMTDGLYKLSKYIQLSQDGDFNGKEMDSWGILFNDLWQLSEEEKANVRKTQAEADKIYIELGVLNADEVRDSRFGGDKYSMETTIDKDEIPDR
jgi:hypothetical protein